jgi:Transposase DDE domain
LDVAVGPMNIHDGSALEPALGDAEVRGINPEVVLADSHYGSDENLAKAKIQDIEVISPSMPPKGSKQEKLTLEHFELDEHGRVVRCPQGHAPLMTSVAEDEIQVLFEAAQCAGRPLHASCCASAVDREEPRRQYTRARQRARRLYDHSDESKGQYQRRAAIEGTVSRLKYQMHITLLRCRGRAAVGCATFLRALGLNIVRVGAY